MHTWQIPNWTRVVPWHSRPAEIISVQKSINSIYIDFSEFNDKTRPLNDDGSESHRSCRAARQITVLAYTQAAVLIKCYGAGLTTIETHYNVVKHRCSMPGRGQMDVLPERPFYVYIENLTAKPIELLKLMKVACALSDPTCIIHARDDGRHMLEGKY